MLNSLMEKELIAYLKKQDDVEFAVVFGSQVSGRVTPMSDIDIAIYFKNKKDILELGERQIDITCALIRLYKNDKVDVVILNLANPFLKFQVLKYGRLLCVRDEKLFYHFKAATLGMYQQIKPMYDFYDKSTEVSLRRGLYG